MTTINTKDITAYQMKETLLEIFGNIKEQDEYCVFGVRFEEKERQVGEICENSRNNVDREDERDFPEYGTQEYEEMEEMDGTSAWCEESILSQLDSLKNLSVSMFGSKHAYVVAGYSTGWEQNNGLIDDGEVVIQDAVVLHKIY